MASKMNSDFFIQENILFINGIFEFIVMLNQ